MPALFNGSTLLGGARTDIDLAVSAVYLKGETSA